MADLDGPGIAEDVYRQMCSDPQNVEFRDAASAFNPTTRAMQRTVPLSRWANPAHIDA
jgi:hypothetical protein